jgi:type I restriction enzyme S subunit
MRWPKVALGEVLARQERAERTDPEKEYRLLGVRLAGRGAFHRETLLGAESSAPTLSPVRGGDLIYSRLFASQGAFAIVPTALEDCWVSNEFILYRARDERVRTDYVWRWLTQEHVWKIVERDCFGSTPGTRNRYAPQFFEALEVPLPPLAEQERIVRRLDAVEARLAARRRAAEAVEAELAQALAAAFQRITAHAPRARMGDVAPLVRRAVSIDVDAEYPELGIRSFGKGTFHKPALSGAEVGSKRLFEVHAGDLLFSNVFAWEGAVAVAQSADHGRFGSHRFITRRVDPARATADFLCYWFLTPEGLQRLGEASPGGAGRNRTLGLDALDRIEVPLPPLDAQRWFDRLQQKARAAREASAAASGELDRLLPALLAEAFGP